MGRRKKSNKKLKKNVKEFIIAVLIIVILYFANKYGILQEIDNSIRDTGLKNVVDTRQNNSNTIIKTVKINEEIKTSISENINLDRSKLNIIFFDVGQADATLITLNTKNILIDAGNRSDGINLVSAIKALGIEKLDIVIGTHVHEDHIGGMSNIIDAFDIGKFYLPYDDTTTTSYYEKLLVSLTNKNLSITGVDIGDEFEEESAKFKVMYVDNNQPENKNLESIIIQMTYGDLKYLFMGDAEKSVEDKVNWEDIDVLKIGHHGSDTSSSIEFINKVLPEIGIISVGKDNMYNLPKEKILKRYNDLGTMIYRTDTDGTIQIVSDGNKNEIVKVNISLDG